MEKETAPDGPEEAEILRCHLVVKVPLNKSELAPRYWKKIIKFLKASTEGGFSRDGGILDTLFYSAEV